MVDGRHVVKYSKRHNSPTKGPTGTQLAWSHPIMFSASPRHGGHVGNMMGCDHSRFIQISPLIGEL